LAGSDEVASLAPTNGIENAQVRSRLKLPGEGTTFSFYLPR
jgi:hypothetical protein